MSQKTDWWYTEDQRHLATCDNCGGLLWLYSGYIKCFECHTEEIL